MGEADQGEEEEELVEIDSAALELRCGFHARAWDDLVPAETLAALQAQVELGAGGGGLGGSSFWVGAEGAPRTPLEHFALDVWALHMRGRAPAECDPARSGVEYWVQRRGSQMPRGAQSINWHFDKDEELREAHGLFVHPFISTVTYLSDAGAPTVVMPVQIELDGSGARASEAGGSAAAATVSYPRRGRHLAFTGRALHGCPLELAFQKRRQRPYERLTVLVNLWINHRPAGVERAPPDAAPPTGKRTRLGAGASLARADAPPQLEVRSLGAGASASGPRGARSAAIAFEFPVGDAAVARVRLTEARALRRLVEAEASPPVLSVPVEIDIVEEEAADSEDDDSGVCGVGV